MNHQTGILSHQRVVVENISNIFGLCFLNKLKFPDASKYN